MESKNIEHDLLNFIRCLPGEHGLYRVENGNLRTLYYSKGLPTMSGLTETEYKDFTSNDASRIIYKDDVPLIKGFVRDVLNSGIDGNETSATYRIYHKTEGFSWINAKARVIGISEAGPLIFGTFQSESRSSYKYRLLLDNVRISIYVVDRKRYEILYLNQHLRDMYGERPFLGEKCYSYFFGYSKPCEWCAMNKTNGEIYKEKDFYLDDKKKLV